MTALVHIYASANKLRESHPPNWIILTSKTVSRLDKNHLPRRTKSHAISLLYVHESYLIYSRLLSETQARACAHTDVDGEGEYPAWKFRETYGTFVREKRALRSSLCIIPECVCVCVRVCVRLREKEKERGASVFAPLEGFIAGAEKQQQYYAHESRFVRYADWQLLKYREEEEDLPDKRLGALAGCHCRLRWKFCAMGGGGTCFSARNAALVVLLPS